jgi:hypothetical protein
MSPISQFFLLAAIELGGLFLIWFLIRAKVRRYLELENLLAGVREEARSLILELNETADRNVSLVEDRLDALHGLLDEVDRRIGVERRELVSRDKEREVYARLNKRRPIVPEAELPIAPLAAAPRQPPVEGTRGPLQASSEEQAPIRLSLGPIPGAVDEAPGDGAPLPRIGLASDPISSAKSQRDEALDLYRQGFSADLIAARVGATVAEIELLIEIEERRSAARGSIS